MNSQQVDMMLASYKACTARIGHLQAVVAIAMRRRQRMLDNAMYAEALTAHKYDGLPHGTDINSPVENLIIKFDEGYVPKYIQDMDTDIQRIDAELFEMQQVITFVDSWMLSLSERERFIIQRHVIEKCYWKDVLDEYEEKWGIFSKEGLRKIKKRALGKIYEAAA